MHSYRTKTSNSRWIAEVVAVGNYGGQEQLRLESLTKAVDAAEESIRLAELYYEQGLANLQTVLDAQRSLFALQDRLTVSRANVTLNRIKLYKSLGGGWEVHADGNGSTTCKRLPQVIFE